ncbi:MAG: sigma-70 family RNA polymerase sigma factor [Candidatus Omnitrophica bacterium]|nr:sigma-70 family RNA polymerase sigma factor [Candidatus Omnitrophota bacterium]
MRDPDGSLVSRAKKGDKDAFGKLVKQYYEMVYGLALGVCREREAARDIAQEAFFKAFRQLEHFEGRSKFKTWLYRIAMNTAIDFVRRKKPVVSMDQGKDEYDEIPLEAGIADENPNPRDLASQSELRERIDRAIEKLSPEHRAILVLREWQQLSYEDIAETLEIESGTVMSRLFYARKKLGEILRHEDEGIFGALSDERI